VQYDAEDFSVALSVLEQHGAPSGYGNGASPGLQWRIVRTESRFPKTNDMPNSPRPIVSEWLRPL
jgi:hypothetical protein